jgi:hypothetical protein
MCLQFLTILVDLAAALELLIAILAQSLGDVPSINSLEGHQQ